MNVLYDSGSHADYSGKVEAISRRLGVHAEYTWDGTVEVPQMKIDPELQGMLHNLLPDNQVSMDSSDRLMHSFGKSSVEILKFRLGLYPDAVNAVIFPDKDTVEGVIRTLNGKKVILVPFGGGTSVNGSLDISSSRKIISLDTRNLRNLEIHSNYVLSGPGFTGEELEEALNRNGLTTGNFPESFLRSTVGGWVATRASGQESNQYGGIDNLLVGVTLATSEGLLRDLAIPRNSYPLDTQRLALGAGGKTGLITEILLKKMPIPRKRHFATYMFRSYKEGINSLSRMQNFPSVARLSDEVETSISLEGEFRGVFGGAFEKYLEFRKVRNGSMLIMVNNDSRIPEKPSSCVNATGIPARKWFKDRYSRPELGNLLWKKGFIPDTLETATTWDRLFNLHSSVTGEFHKAMEDNDSRGIIMSHLSHMYQSGACIYFTFVLWKEREQLDLLLEVRDMMVKCFNRNGAAVTHHHGTGEYFGKYLDPILEKKIDSLKDPLFSEVVKYGH